MLYFPLIAYTLFGIVCIYFIVSGIKKVKEVRKEMSEEKPVPKKDSFSDLYENEAEHDAAINNDDDFDSAYFERVRNGEKSQLFLEIGGVADCSMIRSLLFSENIPSYIENEHVNKIYSFGGLNSAFSIRLFILVADYEKAYEIVDAYVKGNAVSEEGEENTVAKTSAAVAGAMFFIPLPEGSEQKTMGITVLPKITE